MQKVSQSLYVLTELNTSLTSPYVSDEMNVITYYFASKQLLREFLKDFSASCSCAIRYSRDADKPRRCSVRTSRLCVIDSERSSVELLLHTKTEQVF